MAAPTRTHVKIAVLGFLSVSAIVFALTIYEWRRRKRRNNGAFEDIVEDSNKAKNLPVTKSHSASFTHVRQSVNEAPHLMTKPEAEMLTSALATDDERLLEKVLVTISNSSAFTQNQNLLRESGCLEKLTSLLEARDMAVKTNLQTVQPRVVNGVITSINNLAVNEQNQKKLQDSIPALINFAQSKDLSESVQLSSLQALTNLSTLSEYHAPYTQIIQHLYELLDDGEFKIQMQSLKVLVNLSLNPDMVPHLLAAKAPSKLLHLLKPSTEEELLLRLTTVLSNITNTAKSENLTSAGLPTDYKAPSPETMYTALYGVGNSAQVRSKVFVLSKHTNSEIRQNATSVYGML